MSTQIIPFSKELAQQLLDTGEQFPVDFELAWQWLGYQSKESALDLLFEDFRIGFDYLLIPEVLHPCADFITEHAEEPRLNVLSIIAKILSPLNSPAATARSTTESLYSDALAKRLKGKREVCCSQGRIDVLTNTYVIEVKISDWRAGLAQALVYASCYPDKIPVVFVVNPPKNIDYVLQLFKKHGVELWTQKKIRLSTATPQQTKTKRQQVGEWAVESSIFLTTSCFKHLAILAETQKGEDAQRLLPCIPVF